jgi:hypothetical protein
MKKTNKNKILYKLTAPNGKVYIGITSQSFKKRMGIHKWYAKNKNGKLQNSIKKYGWDNFKKEIIIESNTLSWDELCNLEKVYIKKYDTFKNGLNASEGGEGPNGRKKSRTELIQQKKNSKCVIDRNIYVYTKDGRFFGEFISAKELSNFIGFKTATIRDSVNGRHEKTFLGNFYITYNKGEFPNIDKINEFKLKYRRYLEKFDYILQYEGEEHLVKGVVALKKKMYELKGSGVNNSIYSIILRSNKNNIKIKEFNIMTPLEIKDIRFDNFIETIELSDSVHDFPFITDKDIERNCYPESQNDNLNKNNLFNNCNHNQREENDMKTTEMIKFKKSQVRRLANGMDLTTYKEVYNQFLAGKGMSLLDVIKIKKNDEDEYLSFMDDLHCHLEETLEKWHNDAVEQKEAVVSIKMPSYEINEKYIEKCSVCGRKLSAHKSVRMGMGNTCSNNQHVQEITTFLESYDTNETIANFNEDTGVIKKILREKLNYLDDLFRHLNSKRVKDSEDKAKLKVVKNFSAYYLNQLFDEKSPILNSAVFRSLSRFIQNNDKSKTLLKYKVINKDM